MYILTARISPPRVQEISPCEKLTAGVSSRQKNTDHKKVVRLMKVLLLEILDKLTAIFHNFLIIINIA